MQLKDKHNKTKSIREKLALATCALLQTAGSTAQAGDEWEIDSALMIYSENDSRVTAIEPIVSARKEMGEDKFFGVKLVLDALTGATPNGAHASGTAQTFTRPSGNGSYTVAAGENPLDDTFHDTRVALSADWEQPILDDMSRIIVGGNLSKEFDYRSLGVSATFLRDFNNRNTTFSAALGVNADTISPVGDVPTPFANMMVAGSGTNRDKASESKTITDLMFGVTQVIDRKTLMQFNLGLSSSSGYMNDPYKVLTVVDATGTRLAPVGNDLPYVYENRPDSRSRQTFYWKTVHHLNEDVINLAYRYHTDDWDINSHTIDLNYRYELNGGAYLQPHIRYYTQSAAEFFTHNILDTQVGVAQYASADYRLGELTTTTIGLKYALPFKGNQELSMRAESIVQSYSKVDSAVGTLAGDAGSQDIVPDLGAFVIQVGYSFYW
ncbi:MAG: DUF3570 domain-containing protein [Gammaproteobacteria bacterium]|nr:DUF3570 domain-containing protein [Gammaproteobacteria bacterium]MDH5735662.1 DUF3570 domain-containing protein [Gammaproteobacteria bacterium]